MENNISKIDNISGSVTLPQMNRQPLVSEISRRRKLNFLTRHLKSPQNILEIGTGDGWFSANLRKLGHKVTTIDLMPPADIVGDITKWHSLGLQEHSFDVIVGLEVIEHVDCVEALQSLCRKNGIIFLSSPHPRWDWAMLLLERFGLTQQRTSPHDNLVEFKKLPFGVIQIKRPMWIHQVGIFRNN